LTLTVEKNPARQQANRDANKAANPTQVGTRATNTAGHEVPYASTQEGGALAMRRITDATQNSGHGNALNQFYKQFNLNTGDVFVVALFEPTPKLPAANPLPAPFFDPQFRPILIPITPIPTISPTFRPIPIPIPIPVTVMPLILPGEGILRIILGLKDDKPDI